MLHMHLMLICEDVSLLLQMLLTRKILEFSGLKIEEISRYSGFCSTYKCEPEGTKRGD